MTLRRTLLSTAAAVLAIGSLASCGDDDDTSADGGDTTASDGAVDLDGRSFVAQELEGFTLVEGSEVVVSFADGSVVIEAGCNTQSGGYEITDGTLVITGELASSMRACDDPLMDQDAFMADLVASEPTVELDGDQLVISGADASATLAELA
jgi:heat shock protein HslJ